MASQNVGCFLWLYTERQYNWTVFVLYGPVAFKNLVGFTTLQTFYTMASFEIDS